MCRLPVLGEEQLFFWAATSISSSRGDCSVKWIDMTVFCVGFVGLMLLFQEDVRGHAILGGARVKRKKRQQDGWSPYWREAVPLFPYLVL
jgi:hypothetical protein